VTFFYLNFIARQLYTQKCLKCLKTQYCRPGVGGSYWCVDGREDCKIGGEGRGLARLGAQWNDKQIVSLQYARPTLLVSSSSKLKLSSGYLLSSGYPGCWIGFKALSHCYYMCTVIMFVSHELLIMSHIYVALSAHESCRVTCVIYVALSAHESCRVTCVSSL